MGRLRMAVIGVGHLGKEHARILAGLPDVELVGVADVNLDQAQVVAQRCGTQAYADYWPLLNLVDAVTIAAPTTHHHALAAEFLRRGLPVLVEKPLAATLEEGQALVELSRQHGAALQVGHIERFNPAFEELARRPLQPKFVECERLGPFSGRSTDIGVVLDLMIHDLDLLLALVRAPVRSVEAVGVTVYGRNEDVANARLVFANGCVANVSASRVGPAPRRRMRVWGPEGYAHLDFAQRHLTLVQPSDQLRRQGLEHRNLDPAGLALLKQEIFGRHLQVLRLDHPPEGDQLTRELQHFAHCVRTGERPRVRGEEACEALALAARILESLRAHPWDGQAGGPAGPLHLPAPLGPLFQPRQGGAAA
jgi:predicted dehydrogenase